MSDESGKIGISPLPREPRAFRWFVGYHEGEAVELRIRDEHVDVDRETVEAMIADLIEARNYVWPDEKPIWLAKVQELWENGIKVVG